MLSLDDLKNAAHYECTKTWSCTSGDAFVVLYNYAPALPLVTKASLVLGENYMYDAILHEIVVDGRLYYIHRTKLAVSITDRIPDYWLLKLLELEVLVFD